MGKPSRILDVPGSYLEFDKHGKVLQGYLAQGAFEAMETYDALERSPAYGVNFACRMTAKKRVKADAKKKDGRSNPRS
jgi:hypothetical protein